MSVMNGNHHHPGKVSIHPHTYKGVKGRRGIKIQLSRMLLEASRSSSVEAEFHSLEIFFFL